MALYNSYWWPLIVIKSTGKNWTLLLYINLSQGLESKPILELGFVQNLQSAGGVVKFLREGVPPLDIFKWNIAFGS